MVYVAQLRRPSSGPGRMLARSMNASHDKLTRWGLNRVEIEPGFTMLDVGCGGGRTIETLGSVAPEGQVFGVDYSSASVAVARERNRASIERGRVDIREGVVSSLPFADHTFELVTAVETHYYRADLPGDVREVMRAAYLTPEQHGRLLSDAGYRDVEVFTEQAHGWICEIGHTSPLAQARQ